ncbi:MAG: ABC transporter ATP-binding protein [Planctomycetes bacterium]|nr:ABC transporter ATP-binding protein [Planctomycetota bacterium]
MVTPAPARPEPVAIETVGLTKIFKDFWGRPRVIAVDDLSLAVRRGEVVGLLGPNGSGKSTTIELLLGLLDPTRGIASVLGHHPRDVRVKHRIGYLPEESPFYRYLTGRETLDFFGRIFGLAPRERRRRVDRLIDLVGLGEAARRRVGEYSKGMGRRIGMAQALINDPDLVILDEPTAGLDPIGAREVKDLIRELRRRGKTVLLSSHLLADVEDVCDRIAILYGGRLRAEGAVADLLGRPDGSRMRLDAYFLDVVARAEADRLATSGARAARGVERLLDGIAKEEPEPSPSPAPPPDGAAPDGPRRDVIDRLLRGEG